MQLQFSLSIRSTTGPEPHDELFVLYFICKNDRLVGTGAVDSAGEQASESFILMVSGAEQSAVP